MERLHIAALAGALTVGAAPPSPNSPSPLSGLGRPIGAVPRAVLQAQLPPDPLTSDVKPAEPALKIHPGLTSETEMVARFEPAKPGEKPELTPIKPTFHRINNLDGSYYQSGTLDGKAGNELEMYLKAKGENDKCSIIIKDPKGNVIGTQVISTNKDGYVHTTLKLPEDGKFSIEVKPGDVTAQKPNPAVQPGGVLVEKPVIATIIIGSKPQKMESK